MNAPTESVTRAADVPPGPTPHESAFQQVVGRLPNGAERARFDAIRDALRLRDDDAVWTLFVALEYYLNLYERFPAMIRGRRARTADRVQKQERPAYHPRETAGPTPGGRRRRRGGASGGRGACLAGEDHSTGRPPDRARGRLRHPLALDAGQRGGDGGGVDPHRRGRPGFRAPAGLRGRLHGGLCRGDAAATVLRSPHGPTQQALAAMRTASFFTDPGPGRIRIARWAPCATAR